MRQATLDTVDALTAQTAGIVAVHTTGRRAYDARRDGPGKWGYPMVGTRFDLSRRICR
jgi:hypothetical protein